MENLFDRILDIASKSDKVILWLSQFDFVTDGIIEKFIEKFALKKY